MHHAAVWHKLPYGNAEGQMQWHIGPTWRLAMEWKTLIEDFRAGLQRDIAVVTCASHGAR